MIIKTHEPPIARGGVGIPVRPSGKSPVRRPREAWPFSDTASAHFGRPLLAARKA
jgi:hypothetical protein